MVRGKGNSCRHVGANSDKPAKRGKFASQRLEVGRDGYYTGATSAENGTGYDPNGPRVSNQAVISPKTSKLTADRAYCGSV